MAVKPGSSPALSLHYLESHYYYSKQSSSDFNLHLYTKHISKSYVVRYHGSAIIYLAAGLHRGQTGLVVGVVSLCYIVGSILPQTVLRTLRTRKYRPTASEVFSLLGQGRSVVRDEFLIPVIRNLPVVNSEPPGSVRHSHASRRHSAEASKWAKWSGPNANRQRTLSLFPPRM